ncbi:MAG: hypothetical protein Q9203_003292 [Teloschistes exilis]
MVHDSLKLIVLTRIITHPLTLAGDTTVDIHQQLRVPLPSAANHETHSSQLLNKQIQFLLSGLHYDPMKMVLFRIQRELRHSNGKQYWGGLFSSILVLAIVIERLEFEVRCQEATDKEEGVIRQDDRTADDAIVSMDEQLIFLQNLFTQKYRIFSPKGLNPLLNSQIRASLDHETQAFATSADEIVRDYSKLYGDGIEVLYDKLTREIGLFLEAREVLGPPPTYKEPRASRLLERFLLGFYPKETLH